MRTVGAEREYRPQFSNFTGVRYVIYDAGPRYRLMHGWPSG